MADDELIRDRGPKKEDLSEESTGDRMRSLAEVIQEQLPRGGTRIIPRGGKSREKFDAMEREIRARAKAEGRSVARFRPSSALEPDLLEELKKDDHIEFEDGEVISLVGLKPEQKALLAVEAEKRGGVRAVVGAPLPASSVPAQAVEDAEPKPDPKVRALDTNELGVPIVSRPGDNDPNYLEGLPELGRMGLQAGAMVFPPTAPFALAGIAEQAPAMGPVLGQAAKGVGELTAKGLDFAGAPGMAGAVRGLFGPEPTPGAGTVMAPGASAQPPQGMEASDAHSAQVAAMQTIQGVPGAQLEGIPGAVAKHTRQSVEDADRAQADAVEATTRAMDRREWLDWEVRQRSAKAEIETAELADRAAQRKLEGTEMAQRAMARHQAVLAEVGRTSRASVDPNRFWASKDGGQKALTVLSGFLFGFTGQGMEFLQRLDGLVTQDLELQKGDRASAVAGLRDQAQGHLTEYNAILQQANSDAEAILLKRSAILDSLRLHAEQIGRETASTDVQQRAAAAVAALAQRGAETAMQYHQVVDQGVNQRNLVALRAEENRISRAAAIAKIRADGPGKLASGESEKLASTYNAIEGLKKMRALAASSGVGERLWRKGAQVLDPREKAARNEFDRLKIGAMKDTAGSALQKHEVELIQDLFGGRADLVDPVTGLDEAIRTLQDRYNTELQFYGAGRVSELPRAMPTARFTRD